MSSMRPFLSVRTNTHGGSGTPDRSLLRTVDIAVRTGPLDRLSGKKVLVLADEENLTFGARQIGKTMYYGELASILRKKARQCSLHAFFSRTPGDTSKDQHLSSLGWITHARDIETVRTYRGVERRSNSDNLILFSAGLLVSRSAADVIVLGSGDGDLVSDLVMCLRSLPRSRRLMTLSLAGSTSRRLDATHNSDIEANIELGQDCLL